MNVQPIHIAPKVPNTPNVPKAPNVSKPYGIHYHHSTQKTSSTITQVATLGRITHTKSTRPSRPSRPSETRPSETTRSLEPLETTTLATNVLPNTYAMEANVSPNSKVAFRQFCLNHLPYLRSIPLPDVHPKVTREEVTREAVLVEFRELPHVEFLIRNAILKLGIGWNHTLICGKRNYAFMVSLCSAISPRIRVVCTSYDNLMPSDYSLFLASEAFWNLLQGEKILLYQDDTCIFRSNVDEFLQWDYIGAPWPKGQNDNQNGVGNGGLSLRTRSVMLDVIRRVSITDFSYNSSTVNYMRNTQSYVPPEDVYFSKAILDLGIGRVADWDSAFAFSTETQVNRRSFGGHQFWLNDPEWKDRMFDSVVVQFVPKYSLTTLEHRGGWKTILESMIQRQWFCDAAQCCFYDIVESEFLWKPVCPEQTYRPWAGVIHCTPQTPPYLNIVNISVLFDETQSDFIRALDHCLFLVTLSTPITQYLQEQLARIGKSNVPVHTLIHPVVMDGVVPFQYDRFLQNRHTKLLQVGSQLRKVSSIYQISLPTAYEKVWLTGTRDMKKCSQLLQNELQYLGIDPAHLDLDSVTMMYTQTFAEYDALLAENIVFVDLFDAAANNTVLECIVRNTPLLIRKIPAVVEYLGEDYPLYFTTLEEAAALLADPSNLLAAHQYLRTLDREKLSISYFIRQLFGIVAGCHRK